MEHMGSNHQTKPGKPLYGSDARTRREAKVVGIASDHGSSSNKFSCVFDVCIHV